jgi:hypothetical protein
MKTSRTATIVWMVALLLILSACGGGISLGNNNGPSANDGGNPAGLVDGTTAPSADGGSERPAVDANLPPSRPDAGPPNDDASTSADAADLGLYATRSDCGYTQVDPHNCGSCGHDCAGGACQAGVCVPLPPGVLASGVIAPTSVVVDANNVYWLSEGVYPDASAVATFDGLVQVMKCAKTGCNNRPTVLASGVWNFFTGKDTLHGLAVDGTGVYWATELSLFACAVDGCNNSPTMLFPTANVPAPSVISAGGGVVYDVSEYGVFGCATSGCSGDGGSGTSNVLWHGLAEGVLVDSTTAYWNDNGSLLACALGGCNGAPTLLDQPNVAVLESMGQIAQDNNYLYYTYGAPTAFQLGHGPGYIASPGQFAQVFSCSKKGIASGGTALLGMYEMSMGAILSTSLLGLATDGTNVYFTDLGNGVASGATDVGRIAKCSVTGCMDLGTTIADHLQNPRGVAVDDANVYWADFGSGTLDSNKGLLLSVDGRIMTSPK